jgi:hypothetical protein
MPFFLVLICLNELKRRDRVPIPSADIDSLATPPDDPYAKFGGEEGDETTETEAGAPTTGTKPAPNG